MEVEGGHVMVVRLGDENSIAMVDEGEVTTCRSWSHRSRQRCTRAESRNLGNVKFLCKRLVRCTAVLYLESLR